MKNEPIIIDPPVSAYSPPDDIQEWIDTLHEMEPSPDVDDAIREAEVWLKRAADGSGGS